MDLLTAVADGWSWKGIEPVELIDQNAFGNVIVRTAAGSFWRICPEIPEAKVIAYSDLELERVRNNPEFILDWKTEPLVQRAADALGDLGPGRCYCLKIAAVLGGEYGGTNIGTIDTAELLSFSGDLARQLDGVPDGGQVRLVIGKPPSS